MFFSIIFLFLAGAAFCATLYTFHRSGNFPWTHWRNTNSPFSSTPDHKVLPTSIVPSISPTPTPGPRPAQLQWGAYMSGQTREEKQEFFEKVSGQPKFIATFVHWGNENEFPQLDAQIAQEHQATLVIFWEAMDYNNPELDPAYSYQKILAGNFDEYIENFRQQTAEYGNPVILIPFEEMNSDWYNWSGPVNGNSALLHQQAFRYLREKFRPVSNVQFAWVVNQESVPDVDGNRIADYYPGDAVVDLVGVNGFNFADPWQSFAEVFAPALEQLSHYHKPALIFSMACAEGPEKAAWIRNALTEELVKYPQLQAFIWFNENKERDWRIWSDSNSLAAFNQAITAWPFAPDPGWQSPL